MILERCYVRGCLAKVDAYIRNLLRFCMFSTERCIMHCQVLHCTERFSDGKMERNSLEKEETELSISLMLNSML